MAIEKSKKILVIGMGKSGMAATKALVRLGAKVLVYDSKAIESVENDFLNFLKENNISYSFGEDTKSKELAELSLAVVSPGVPLDIPLIIKIKELKIDIIGELELAYLIGLGNYVAITGTNGKTTTTTLVGEIFKGAKIKTEVVGNIGVPVVSRAENSTEDTWLVTEVSSFQLETIKTFKPHISALLNITPDHLNRHKTMEKYADVKSNIFMNQDKEDYFIVNGDDEISMNLAKKCKAKIVPFSRKKELPFGAFVNEENVVLKDESGKCIKICSLEDIQLLGLHNLENVLAAAAICFFSGIDAEVIGREIRNFTGVEHRMELLESVDGIRFINDSKGTNPDASIKAIEAMEGDVILIAGGYDKSSDYTEFIGSFQGKVKYLILLGKTAAKIKETAIKLGFNNIFMAKDMDECVEKAFGFAKSGYTILLSPACASWDMYSSFEERGEHFKKCVNLLRS